MNEQRQRVTDEMMDELVRVGEDRLERCYGEAECSRGDAIQHVIEAVLALLPDVEPFTFPGESRPVFLHPCGTVSDADPAHEGIENSTWEQIKAGECDCESGQPWQRIYVDRGAR